MADLLERHTQLAGIYHISSEPIDKFRLLGIVNKAFNAGIKIDEDDAHCIDRSLDGGKFRKSTGFEPDNWESMINRMASDPTPYENWK